MAEQSEIELDEVKKLVVEHKGMGRVAKELGLHPGNLSKIGNQIGEQLDYLQEEENTSVETESKAGLEAETKITTETKGNVKAHGLEKENQKLNSKGKATVEIKANLGIGIGNGNSKKDR